MKRISVNSGEIESSHWSEIESNDWLEIEVTITVIGRTAMLERAIPIKVGVITKKIKNSQKKKQSEEKKTGTM